MAASTSHCITRFLDIDTPKFSLSTPSSILFRNSSRNAPKRQTFIFCSLPLNGCGGDPRKPVGTIETRTFPAVSSPAMAMEALKSAIADMEHNPPSDDSGIIRFEVPIKEQIDALDWLHSQDDTLLPRTFFSGRSRVTIADYSATDEAASANGNALTHISTSSESDNKLVSVAGVGSAVLFRDVHPFSFDDYLAINRFLSKNCPLIRAYGAIRFDGKATTSPEWSAFGSFYFVVPQVEFNELEGSSVIAATVAWDSALSLSYQKAVNSLQETIKQVSSVISSIRKETSQTSIKGTSHIPNRTEWDVTVNKVLDMIGDEDLPLKKVVLARRTQVETTTEVDPLEWLATFKADGPDAYQFCLQPFGSPAFIGNTPEQLFCRDKSTVFSEALAATRARGGSEALDIQIAQDLFSSQKDHNEFAIVRENVKQILEAECSSVLVQPKKVVRKLTRIQHLYARFAGILRSEDAEFKILSSLHPTPAVCGLPMEDARKYIVESEMFDRGLYAGPVGFFGGDKSEFSVGIRSALVGKDVGALIYAGLGVVEGSVPALEWQELELKASQFMKLMKQEEPVLTTKAT